VQTGSVGGSAVMVDVTTLGSDVAVAVTIGATPYVAIHPPGWPTRPQDTGGAIAEGSTVTFAAGATVQLLRCEAAALVAGGWASYA
jgi:hypothetical protein